MKLRIPQWLLPVKYERADSPVDAAFERMAREFLAQHPEIQHEWRPIKRWWGERLDLICGVGAPNEVFVGLSGGSIAVGVTKGAHDDFEDFGRRISDEQLAREAFERFLEVLSESGLLRPT